MIDRCGTAHWKYHTVLSIVINMPPGLSINISTSITVSVAEIIFIPFQASA